MTSKLFRTLRLLQPLSEELDDPNKLLNESLAKLVEATDSQRGCFLFSKNERWVEKASVNMTNDLTGTFHHPTLIFDAAIESRNEILVYDDARQEFAGHHDSYIRDVQPRSVLCTMFGYYQMSASANIEILFYLESNSIGAFSAIPSYVISLVLDRLMINYKMAERFSVLLVENARLKVELNVLKARNENDFAYVNELALLVTNNIQKVRGIQGRAAAHLQLSALQINILKLLAQGKGNKEIAEQLSLTENAVATRLSRLYETINVRNRVEATLYAIHHNISVPN